MDYTVGFAFNENSTEVLLIRKLKPEWQKGLLNGIGGKIKDDEKPYDCMVREFQEETGLYQEHWINFAFYSDPNTDLHLYFCLMPDSVFYLAESKTPEIVGHFSVDPLPSDTIPNLQWLIPLALDTTTRRGGPSGPTIFRGFAHDT